MFLTVHATSFMTQCQDQDVYRRSVLYVTGPIMCKPDVIRETGTSRSTCVLQFTRLSEKKRTTSHIIVNMQVNLVNLKWVVFTVRRYASAVYAVVVCVCVCVCVSVTLQYYIKTAKRSILQITPQDSAGTLVF